MKKLFILLFTFNISLLPLFSQPITQEWVRRYSGISTSGSGGLSVKLDSAGNVYVLSPVSTSLLMHQQGGDAPSFTGKLTYLKPSNIQDD